MTTTPDEPTEDVDQRDDPDADSLSTPTGGLSGETAGFDGQLAPATDGSSDSGVPEDDDDRERTSDLADAGWDDRQEDGTPDAPRETPEEFVDNHDA